MVCIITDYGFLFNKDETTKQQNNKTNKLRGLQSARELYRTSERHSYLIKTKQQNNKTNSVAFSPQANYTD
jgi:viroplasmin and RNaseH domain-containing protein